MSVAVRPYLSAGLALASVGVIAAAPVVAEQQGHRLANDQVALTGTVSNVLTNTVNAILNIPSAELAGVQQLTAAMFSSQNWFIYSPVNVLGADPSNPEMVRGLVNMLVPFPAFSHPTGEQINYWFMANFPMNAGCTGFPPCPDFFALTDVMFKVPGFAFNTPGGYTFAEPLTPTNNPVSDQEGQWNADLGQTGLPVSWYAETVHLDPFEGIKSVLNYLSATPGTVTIPTVKQIVDTYKEFAKSLWNSFSPFVPQSVLWNPFYSVSALVTRPFAKILCPKCNPYDPFMPIGWEPGGWVPDEFKYVPTSPYNPFKHYDVSHGPIPVDYDFNYKPAPVSVTASAVTAQAPSSAGSDPAGQTPDAATTPNTVAQPPASAASVRANRSTVAPAATTTAAGEQPGAPATATETAASETAAAAAADTSPRAQRAKAPVSRHSK